MGELGFWRLAQEDPGWIAAVDPDGTEHAPATCSPRQPARPRPAGARPQAGRRRRHAAAQRPRRADIYLAAFRPAGTTPDQLRTSPAPEIAYIVADSEAKAFVAHEVRRDAAQAARGRGRPRPGGQRSPPAARSPASARRRARRRPARTRLPEDRTAGAAMHYTSGTTGKPKGVQRRSPASTPTTRPSCSPVPLGLFGIPHRRGQRAPLHLAELPHRRHDVRAATPCTRATRVVFMDKWDPEETLGHDRALPVHAHAHGPDAVPPACCSCPTTCEAKYDVSSMQLGDPRRRARARST